MANLTIADSTDIWMPRCYGVTRSNLPVYIAPFYVLTIITGNLPDLICARVGSASEGKETSMNDSKSSCAAGRSNHRTKWLAVAFAAITATLAQASTVLIDFEDLPPMPSSQMPIPYHGLIFSGNPVYGVSSIENPIVPGVLTGVVSGKNVFVSAGQANSIQAFDFKGDYSAVFTMRSAYFTSAFDSPYDSPLTINALGFDQTGATKFTKTFTVNAGAPTFVSFGWPEISEIELTGGYAAYSANQYVMDNLLVDVNAVDVPEPTPVAMASLGLIVFYFGSCVLTRVLKR